MALAYLLDPTKQYQNRAGVNNVSGWLEVFRMDTDTRATVYSDFAGTVAPAHIGIDNNGRAVMIVESGIAYRVEMYGPDGDLIFTQQPIYTQASGGGIGSLTRVVSTDGSVGVESSTVGSVVTYDLSVANDGSDLLEFVRCDGAERIQNTDIFRPTYTDGTMAIGNQGILLGEGRYYHITAHIRASKNQQREPFYDRIFIGVQTNDGTTTTPITRTSEIIDYSLGLTQDFEFSTDVFAQSDCELELFVTGQDVLGGDIEVLDVEAHRIFSGSPAIPSGVLSRAQAAEIYQRKLIAGQNITITETEEGDIISSTGGGGGGGATYQGGDGIIVNNTTYRISIDNSVVQEKLTAGENITITEDNVISATVPSVDISGKADKVEDAVNGNLAGLDSNGNLTDSGIAADRVVTDPNYVHTDQNFSTELKNKLVNIEAGAEVNVQSDWTESDSSSDAFIKNKPDLSNFATVTDLSGKADKVSGATAGNLAGLDATGNLTDSGVSSHNIVHDASYVHTDNNFTNTLKDKLDGIEAGAEENVQSDWLEQNSNSDAYIRNKPDLSHYVTDVDLSGKADKVENAVAGNLAGLDATGNLTDSGVSALNIVQDPNYVHTDNNFTNTYKNKLEGIQAGAEANVQSDWNETDNHSDAYILNKPTIPVIPPFKELVAGSGITITEGTDTVTIASNGGSGGGTSGMMALWSGNNASNGVTVSTSTSLSTVVNALTNMQDIYNAPFTSGEMLGVLKGNTAFREGYMYRIMMTSGAIVQGQSSPGYVSLEVKNGSATIGSSSCTVSSTGSNVTIVFDVYIPTGVYNARLSMTSYNIVSGSWWPTVSITAM